MGIVNKLFLTILLTFSFLTAGTCNDYKLINGLVAGGDIRYGAILSHHESIMYSLDKNITGLELALSTKTYGRNGWDKLYRYPGLGVGYLYTTLGNRDIFGNAHALFAFIDFPFTAKERKLYFGYRISFGLGYINRQYDVVENPLNMAISTGLNLFGSLRLHTNYYLNKRNELVASLEFFHFSNGKLESPNMGLNVGTLNIGYRWRFKNLKYETLPFKAPALSEKHQTEFVITSGAKTDDQLNDRIYFISSMMCDYKYNISDKYATGVGMDIFYDQSLGPNKVAARNGSYDSRDLFQGGIHGSIYARYSRLTAFGNIGTYVYATYIKYTRVYTRIGLRYDISHKIMVNLSLKAHYANADFLEWGIGYRL